MVFAHVGSPQLWWDMILSRRSSQSSSCSKERTTELIIVFLNVFSSPWDVVYLAIDRWYREDGFVRWLKRHRSIVSKSIVYICSYRFIYFLQDFEYHVKLFRSMISFTNYFPSFTSNCRKHFSYRIYLKLSFAVRYRLPVIAWHWAIQNRFDRFHDQYPRVSPQQSLLKSIEAVWARPCWDIVVVGRVYVSVRSSTLHHWRAPYKNEVDLKF